MLCLAYLKSMEYGFDMDIPKKIINKIEGDIKNTLSFNIIKSLIYSQDLDDGCKIWKNYDTIFLNKDLIIDMKSESIDNVLSYIVIYKDSCD